MTADGASPPEEVNRRRHLRVPITVTRTKVGAGPGVFFGYASDISTGGLGINTLTPKEPGTRHDLEFTLPGPTGATVRCRCEVAWTRKYSRKMKAEPGMGLRFLELSEEMARAIDRWIDDQEWSAGSGG